MSEKIFKNQLNAEALIRSGVNPERIDLPEGIRAAIGGENA